MEKLYFTFGSDPAYPYGRGDYIMAIGTDRTDCLKTFKQYYPPRPGHNTLNCADYYTAAQWEQVGAEYYADKKPVRILVSDTVYGPKPDDFGTLWFYVPERYILVALQRQEDCPTGFQYYTHLLTDSPGMIKYPDFSKLYPENLTVLTCMADLIPYVLMDHYGSLDYDVQILRRPDRINDTEEKMENTTNNLIFSYGGKHFVPIRQFEKADGDFKQITRHLKLDPTFKLTVPYHYKKFYQASTDKTCDIFLCTENRKKYVPCEYALREYLEP